MTEPLLKVEGLSVDFKTKKGYASAVRGLSYELMPGESMAIVGESGSGKSVGALALLGLLPGSASITGTAVFEGEDLISMKLKDLRHIRGNKVAMIFQDPMTAFNPVFTIGDQIMEAIQIHNQSTSDGEARTKAIDLLELVGVPEAPKRVDQYPHEYSGGMRQRAMIAMAISNGPKLLIADEPTTALDVTIQAQVMESLADVRAETGAAMILITHDLGLVANSAERLLVMYGGRVFERGTIRDIFYNPTNPYTHGLLNSIPRLDQEAGGKLDAIPGSPPNIVNMPPGCAFGPRCEFATSVCRDSAAELQLVMGQHYSRCHNTASLPFQTIGVS